MAALQKLMAALAMDGQVERRTVVLAGVTGDGKSSTGNSLCGVGAFKTSGGLVSETRSHAMADYRHGGRFWRVIDTIGLEDTCLPSLEVLRRFSLFAEDCPDGVDAFLFVVRWGRFKPEHEKALGAFAANVGEAALKRTVLCFTHCGDEEASTLDDLLASDGAPTSLRETWLPRMAGAVGVDNLGGEDVQARVQARLDALVEAHGGERYSNAALEAAREAQAKNAEEERAAFAAAISDWRKATGVLKIEREPAAAPKPEEEPPGDGGAPPECEDIARLREVQKALAACRDLI